MSKNTELWKISVYIKKPEIPKRSECNTLNSVSPALYEILVVAPSFEKAVEKTKEHLEELIRKGEAEEYEITSVQKYIVEGIDRIIT